MRATLRGHRDVFYLEGRGSETAVPLCRLSHDLKKVQAGVRSALDDLATRETRLASLDRFRTWLGLRPSQPTPPDRPVPAFEPKRSTDVLDICDGSNDDICDGSNGEWEFGRILDAYGRDSASLAGDLNARERLFRMLPPETEHDPPFGKVRRDFLDAWRKLYERHKLPSSMLRRIGLVGVSSWSLPLESPTSFYGRPNTLFHGTSWREVITRICT